MLCNDCCNRKFREYLQTAASLCFLTDLLRNRKMKDHSNTDPTYVCCPILMDGRACGISTLEKWYYQHLLRAHKIHSRSKEGIASQLLAKDSLVHIIEAALEHTIVEPREEHDTSTTSLPPLGEASQQLSSPESEVHDTSTYLPEGDGQSERGIQTVKQLLRCVLEKRKIARTAVRHYSQRFPTF